MRKWPRIFAVCGSGLLLGTIACEPAKAPAVTQASVGSQTPLRSQLVVRDAWARAADSGGMTAVYFTLENSAAVSDTLTAVRSGAAEEAAMHMSMDRGGTMHMAALRTLPVPGNDSVLFRPMGAHVMLTRLSRPLASGDTVTLTLQFVSGQSLEVRADVRTP